MRKKKRHGAIALLEFESVAAGILASIYFMFITTPAELAPTEDQSILFFKADGPQTATVEYNEVYTREVVQNRREQATAEGKLELVENRRTWLCLELQDGTAGKNYGDG